MAITVFENYTLRLAVPNDSDQVVDLLTRSIVEDPSSAHTGTSAAEYNAYIRYIISACVADHLSWVAEDKAGHAVAALMARDITTPLSDECSEHCSTHTRFRHVPLLLDRVVKTFSKVSDSSGVDAERRPIRGAVVHVLIIGTDPNYQRLGLATALIDVAKQYWRQKGFRSALMQTGRADFRSLADRNGFTELCTLDTTRLISEPSVYTRYMKEGRLLLTLMTHDLTA